MSTQGQGVPVTVRIPTPLRRLTGGASEVPVSAATAGEALDALLAQHGGLGPYLRDERGGYRTFVNIYRNDEDIRYLERERTSLRAGDRLTIVPAVAGG